MTIPDDIVARANADLQRALSRAQRARTDLANAEQEAADLQAFLRTLERYSSDAPARAEREHDKNERAPAKPGSRARDLVDYAILAIKHAGKPQTIGELLDAVLAGGHTVGGTDQKSNLAGYLSRDPRLISRGRAIGWDLAENEEAAPEPASGETASSTATGGTDDRSTLASSGFEDLLGSTEPQVP